MTVINQKDYESMKKRKFSTNQGSVKFRRERPIPLNYMLLILAGIFLLLGLVVFTIIPENVAAREYRTPVLSFLAAFVLTAIGNLVVGFIQKGVSRETERALERPITELMESVEKLRQIQLFFEAGLVGVYPDRSSAMRRFRSEIEREDTQIGFVGTSMQGSLDPGEENEDKKTLYELLKQKRHTKVRIRALLMHPAYGEFRERVENREKAAVARDIQRTLKYLIPKEQQSREDSLNGDLVKAEKLLSTSDVRLYPGVITAFAIFTSRSMLVNLSTLHGPVYDNLTFIIEDTDDPTSIFKKFRANHFEKPWNSEKTVRLEGNDGHEILNKLFSIDFSQQENRFTEGNWPATIPGTPKSPNRSGEGPSFEMKDEVKLAG